MTALLQEAVLAVGCLGLLALAWVTCKPDRPIETRHLERAASYRPRRLER